MSTPRRHWWRIGAVALVAPALAAGWLAAGSGAAEAPPQALEPVVRREALLRPPLERVPAASRPAAPDEGPPAWAPAGMKAPLDRCRVRGGRRFCDGPRRMPRPHGEAARRAEGLELGTYYAGSKLLRSAPRRSWMRAARRLGVTSPDRLLWPVRGAAFGRGFGRVPGRSHVVHDGVDVGADEGRPVRAVADGLVAYADNAIRGLGNVVMVLHGGSTVGVYAHLREGRVFAGQHVRRGEVLGEVGRTGLTRGAHLHFEWRVAGKAVDPSVMFVRPR